MIIFALIISLSIAIINQNRIMEQLKENNQFQIEQIEGVLAHSLQTIDKAYRYFDADTAKRMEGNTNYLLDLYDKNPNFSNWDFEGLKATLGMDIYIIDENNVISHSSLKRDIGVDFEDCCSTLATILNERRASGKFYHDGMDIDQGNGKITKYSYMATEDKKYIIELGYNLQDGEIFNSFSFLQVANEMEKQYPLINEITIYNIGGIPFGKDNGSDGITGNRKTALKEALETNKIVEVIDNWTGKSSVHRFVPFESDFDTGQTKDKIIEIVYNDDELQASLKESRKVFLIQLGIILFITFILSLFISKLVSKPMYLAFHDSLTGLKNRAAFEEILTKEITKKPDDTMALIMFDLDNFKLVNDYFGHDYGDKLLKLVGNKLKLTIGNDNTVFRLGGDEFVVVMPSSNLVKAEQLANNILDSLETLFVEHETYKSINITASIGIVLAPEHGEDLETLYKKADIAMYESKEKGKNQYYIYKGNKNDAS